MKFGNVRVVEASGSTPPFVPNAGKPSPREPWHLSQLWLLNTSFPFCGFPEEGILDFVPTAVVCAWLARTGGNAAAIATKMRKAAIPDAPSRRVDPGRLIRWTDVLTNDLSTK